MNFFTATIPLTLAEKLKENGMPMKDAYTPILYDKPESVMSDCIIPTYAKVFDWLTVNDIDIYIRINVYHNHSNKYYCYIPYVNGIVLKEVGYKNWHEAANAAIEKALTLI